MGGSRAPATIVAHAAGTGKLCVWALHGFLLATLDLSEQSPILQLRVVSEGDAREGLLCSMADGGVEMRTLPYLQRVWRRTCKGAVQPTALSCCPSSVLVWVGLEDGTCEAISTAQP